MRRAVITLATAILWCQVASSDEKTTPSARQLLMQVQERIGKLDALSYQHHIEINLASQAYHFERSARAYLKFDDRLALGARFQFVNDAERYVYNGSESFYCTHADKTVRTSRAPSPQHPGHMFLVNGPLAIRKALGKLIPDNDVAFSLSALNEKDKYRVEWKLHSAYITPLGDIEHFDKDITYRYQILIDRASLLPLEIAQLPPREGDYTKVTLEGFDTTPPPPADESWYFSTLRETYSIDPRREAVKPLPAGTTAPSWTLPVFKGKDEVSLADYKGELLLIEFWISHCGHCIRAVEDLNAIRGEYTEKDLKIIAINTHDDDYVISRFIENNRPKYNVLVKGEAVSQSYGIAAYPSAILVGRDGRILASGIFNAANLRQRIAEALR